MRQCLIFLFGRCNETLANLIKAIAIDLSVLNGRSLRLFSLGIHSINTMLIASLSNNHLELALITIGLIEVPAKAQKKLGYLVRICWCFNRFDYHVLLTIIYYICAVLSQVPAIMLPACHCVHQAMWAFFQQNQTSTKQRTRILSLYMGAACAAFAILAQLVFTANADSYPEFTT